VRVVYGTEISPEEAFAVLALDMRGDEAWCHTLMKFGARAQVAVTAPWPVETARRIFVEATVLERSGRAARAEGYGVVASFDAERFVFFRTDPVRLAELDTALGWEIT
jgi:hypothetical protein